MADTSISETAPPDGAQPTPEDEAARALEERRYRFAKRLVIVMTTLLILAFMATVIGLIMKARGMLGSDARPAQGAISAPLAGNDNEWRVTLQPGESVVDVSASGGLLIVRLTGPEGERVLVRDLASGAAVGTLTLTPAR